MNLLKLYDEAVASQQIDYDASQRQLLQSLQILNDELSIKKGWLGWLKRHAVKGAYIYGPVGVGKTFLMDLFFDNVEIIEKKRFHFHHFMQQVDNQLRQLQGQQNPLHIIATELASSTRLLCFDEFLVDDVAYAMILGELLQALFDKGVILIATSNTQPDNLYWNGIQRARFLPAIEAIKTHCILYNLGDKRDYRLGRQPEINTYLTPLSEATWEQLEEQFLILGGEGISGGNVNIQNRDIPYIQCSQRVIWFDFKVICNLPRSQLDYLEIANRFDTVIVSNVPQLSDKDTVHAILLIHLIDVMYDQGIRLIMSAEVAINQLYTAGEMQQAFKRTASRLHEMQSTDYLKRHPHRLLDSLNTK